MASPVSGTSASVDSGDLGGLLGLNGRGPLLIYVFFSATFLALSFSAGHLVDSFWEGFVLLVVLGCGAGVSAPGRYPLTWGRVVLILLGVAIAISVGDGKLPPVTEGRFSEWHFGAVNFLLFALAMRGRILACWLGMALVAGITALWSIAATGSALHGILLVYGQTAALVAGTFFAVLLRRTAVRTREFHRIEQARIGQELMVIEGERERRIQLEELRQLAGAPLSLIAEGTVTEEDREGLLTLEAELRDRIRGRALRREPLIAAIRNARRRGAEVVLLDDTGEGSDYDIGPEAAGWAAGLVSSESGTTITIRLNPNGSNMTISYVSEGEMPRSLQLSDPRDPLSIHAR